MSRLVIYADGLCEPKNPGGYACWGWAAQIEADDLSTTEVAHDFGCVGHGAGMTNNVAEYVAAGKALRWALSQGRGGVVLRTDSQLVVHQTSGKWACNVPHLQRLRDRLRELVEQTNASLEWVPRERNERADALSRQAYREARQRAA